MSRRLEVDRSILDCFDRETMLRGGASAIVAAGLTWTYGELARRADWVARRLATMPRARADSSQRRVAMLMSHDPPVIAAMLGVMRAGEIGVPLEASAAQKTLASVVADCGAEVIIADRSHLDVARELAGTDRVVIGFDGSEPITADEWEPSSASPDDIALIIYTSGSTGRPKGVVRTHRTMLRIAHVFASSTEIGPADRVSLLAYPNTGQGIGTILGTLTSGATVSPYHLRRSGIGFGPYLQRERITVVVSSPSIWRSMLSTLVDSDQFPSLRAILLGTEPVLARDVAAIRRHVPETCAIFNVFGTTEAGRIASWIVPRDLESLGAVLPVGHPASDLEVSVVDDADRPLPRGSSGEIIVKSKSLASGYWGNPEHTRRTFQPSNGGSSETIYRTGDLGRLDDEGRLVHLGRIDFRVKIRGLFVPLEEVGVILSQHLDLAHAVVSAVSDESGETTLVAHWVPRTGITSKPSAAQLRQFLRERVAEHMVPSAFVEMTALPLTSVGKVDRGALPPPAAAPSDDAVVAPVTETERKLAEVLRKVLEVPDVGRHDNFFDLGGNSLLLLEVAARLKSAGLEVSLQQLFEQPTVAELARVAIDRAPSDASAAPERAIQRDGASSGPLTGPQHWAVGMLFDDDSIMRNSVWAVRVTGRVDPELLERAIGGIVVRHEILRTNYTRLNGELRQVVRPPEAPWLPRVEVTDLPGPIGEAWAACVRAFVVRRFDSEAGPMVRVLLAKTSSATDVVVAIHHAAVDGRSKDLLGEELDASYAALQRDPAADLARTCPPPPFQFLDVVHHWASYRESLEGQRDQEFWQRQLDCEPLRLPIDFSRDAVDDERERTGLPVEFPTASRIWPNPRTLSDHVSSIANQRRASPLAASLSALVATLHRESGQTDICLQHSFDQRARFGGQRVIGFLARSLALRFDLSGSPSHRELVDRVSRTIATALDHSGVEVAVPPARSRANFNFRVYETDEVRLGDLPGVSLALPVVVNTASPFDLLARVRVGARPKFAFRFNARLFRSDTAQRLANRYAETLADMATRLDDPVRTRNS